jgi:protocatechuate 3,4-dioxygenase beta subunit
LGPLASLTSVRAARLAALLALGLLAGPALAGSISGRVADRGTGQALESIDLDLYDAQGKRLGKLDARTDKDGRYRFQDVPPGMYLVKADPPDPPRTYYVQEFWAGSTERHAYRKRQAVPVAVSEAAPEAGGIDFALQKGGTLEGKIVRQDSGAPLAGIDLDLFDADTGGRVPFGAKTDAAGLYRLGPVPPGRYKLRADPDPSTSLGRRYHKGRRTRRRAAPIEVEAGRAVASIDFVLETVSPKSGVNKP